MKVRSSRFMPGNILAAGAALALMLAACAPAASTSTSIAPEGTLASTQAVSTQAVGNGVIVPFTDFKADPTNQKLVYQGTATSLASLPAFDAAKFSDGYVIRATGTDLPAQYDGLIRLGAQLKDVKL